MGAAHGSNDSHSSSHSHHDDFDPEPAKELGPGEPSSPTWLPILGAGLFLVFGVYFLVGQSSDSQASAMPAPSASAAKVAPNPKPAASAPAAPRQPPSRDLDKLRRPSPTNLPSAAPMPRVPSAGRGAPAPGAPAPGGPAPVPVPRP
jgi:hypothetical protein